MIKISKSGNAILVEGLDNAFYPNNGKITYPSNSIILTLDSSNMATFRSAANNDVLFSGLIEDITISGSAVTKDNIAASFGVIAYSSGGGGGGTGAVSSVNGQTGDVILTADSVGAAPNSELTAVKNQVNANEKNIANNSGSIGRLQSSMLTKQDTLVSGTNIKTINGESVLGSGDISVSGGSSSWDDITGKPTIPTAQTNARGNENNYIWANYEVPAYRVMSDAEINQVNGKLLLQKVVWNDPKTTYNVEFPLATKTNDGVMSKEDKATLINLPIEFGKKQATLTAGDNITLSEPDPTTGNVTISATGGGSGGAVSSVNGQTGDVMLTIPTAQTDENGNEKNYIYSDSTNILKQVLIPSFYETNADLVYLMGQPWGGTRPGSHQLASLYAATKTKAGVMSASDKTKLDNIPTMSVLTQAEYDAITTKDANTLYFIKEG